MGDLTSAINQGELTFSSALLAQILDASPDNQGFILPDGAVVRGTVTFTVEQADIVIRRLLVSGGNFSVATYDSDFSAGTNAIDVEGTN